VHSEDFVILACIFLIQITSVTDGPTDRRKDGQTPRQWLSIARKKLSSSSIRRRDWPLHAKITAVCRIVMDYITEIASTEAISPIATHFSVAWSVCPSSVTFVHASCLNCLTDLHALWQVHYSLRDTMTQCVRWGSMTPRRRRDLGELNPQPTCLFAWRFIRGSLTKSLSFLFV